MARVVKEDLWKEGDYMYVVTTNGSLDKSGSLVMGRGAALELKSRMPGIEVECGNVIRWAGTYLGELKAYLYHFEPVIDRSVGIFQVKFGWRSDAMLALIRGSANVLRYYAAQRSDLQIRMNYPGIGYGRLPEYKVRPILEILPDNVTICKK